MAMLIFAPENSPQTPVAQVRPPSQLMLDWLDLELLNAVRRHGRYGGHPWTIINEVAAMQTPETREKARSLRLALWAKLKALIHAKLVFRFAREFVTTSKMPPLERRRSRQSRKLSVRQSGGHKAGSTIELSKPTQTPKPKQIVQSKPVLVNSRQVGSEPISPKTKSAPNPAEVSAAASALASLPRRPKRRWTGLIGLQRAYRGQPVILPSGQSAFVFGVLRRQAVVTLDRGRLLGGPFGGGGPLRWGVMAAEKVKILRNESAQIMGRLKRGSKEKPSLKKAIATRANGCKPARVGSRPRGRPNRPHF